MYLSLRSFERALFIHLRDKSSHERSYIHVHVHTAFTWILVNSTELVIYLAGIWVFVLPPRAVSIVCSALRCATRLLNPSLITAQFNKRAGRLIRFDLIRSLSSSNCSYYDVFWLFYSIQYCIVLYSCCVTPHSVDRTVQLFRVSHCV